MVFRGTKEVYNLLLQLVFCNAVVIGSGILQFTQAQVYVFVLAAFVYEYVHLAFTSSVIVF